MEYDDAGLNLITFLPQVILLVVVSLKFNKIHDINFAMFCQTLIFVTFNKVVTAQYFLWYFSLLPLILPQLGFSKKDILLGKVTTINSYLLLFWFSIFFQVVCYGDLHKPLGCCLPTCWSLKGTTLFCLSGWKDWHFSVLMWEFWQNWSENTEKSLWLLRSSVTCKSWTKSDIS